MKRRTVFFVFLLALCATFVLAVAGLAAAATPSAAPSLAGPVTPAKWTIAIYANGDNDLMYTWPQFTLPALKRIVPSPDVNVVAMLDTPKKDGAWLYKIAGADVTTVRHYSAERDFGSGATFAWFLRQVHTRFPSDHLVVVGWDHGFGWHYFSRDTTSADQILLPELRTAIASAGVPIDVLGFDACNMADAEVTYELAPTKAVGHLVASEEEIDQDGYPYDDMFTPLTADPSQSADEVVQDMVSGWQRYYGSRRNFNWVSLSAVDMPAVGAMKADLVDWVTRLRAGLPAYAARYQAAMHRSLYAWDSWQLDLGGFAANLAADPAITDANLRAASGKVRDDVAAAVLDVTSGSYAAGFSGLTVWAGTGADWLAYRKDYREQVSFGRPVAAGGTGWFAFLRAFNASGAADKREPQRTSLPGRATYGLSDVYFRDAAHGWATGFNNVTYTSFVLRTGGLAGAIWKTSDQSAAGNYLFSALAPAPGGRLWAVGDSGYHTSLIAVSKDGGRTWAQRPSGTKQYLFGVDFPDATHGWVCGAAGTLLRSVDGGKTWKQVASAPSGDLQALDFVDAQHGWLVANDQRGPSATLWYTADAGAHWSAEYVTTGRLLYSVDVVGDAVWAAGGDPAGAAGLIVRGGLGGPWVEQWNGPQRLADVHMADADYGWAVGDGGLVLHTADGASWASQATGVTEDLTAVSPLDSQHAWAVGDGEAILRTTDCGLTWTRSAGDVIGPRTRVVSSTVTSGAVGEFSYFVSDAASTAVRVRVEIRDNRKHVVRSWEMGWRRCGLRQVVMFRCTLPPGSYTVRALAVDQAGNRQSQAVAGTLTVR
ncbi:MAG TPA: clostripain-related cysteine peptidase [Thermoleophilia bacterium]|nr:clostripain-related cysteine peptidase [Thermoleophilia bacterium]